MAKHKIKKILQGVQAIGEAPCDDCEHTLRCGEQRLACKQFEFWTGDGVIRKGVRVPSRRRYNSTYYGALLSTWEEPRQIVPRNEKGSPGERIHITIRRKTA